MNSGAAATAGVSELQRARGREKAAYLWIRVLAVAAIAFVVITSFQARPAPGGHGQALGVAFALVVFCGATIAAMWLTWPRPAVQLAVLLLAVASAAALIGLQGNGAAFLGVFPALVPGRPGAAGSPQRRRGRRRDRRRSPRHGWQTGARPSRASS